MIVVDDPVAYRLGGFMDVVTFRDGNKTQVESWAWRHYDRYLCYKHAKEISRLARLEPKRFPSIWLAPVCLYIPLSRCWECSPLTENELRHVRPELFGGD